MPEPQERVTVIVPTYHHHQLLRQTLLSILNQTVKVKVIIVPVITDEPTLQELEYLMAILENFDRPFKIIPSQIAEPFHQMQLGLDNVDTECFTIFGSDDFMLPNMIEKMLELADASQDSNPVVGLSFALTDAKLNITSIHRLHPFSQSKMKKGSQIPDIALVKANAARLVAGFQDGHNWDYLSHYAFYLRLLKRTLPKVILSPEIGFLYRQMPNSRHALRYNSKEAIKIHRSKVREVARYYWGD